MAKVEKPAKRPLTHNANSKIIGLRLPTELVRDVKGEAARRGLKLNHLFEEMWRLYRQRPAK